MNIGDDVFERGHGYINYLWVKSSWCRRDVDIYIYIYIYIFFGVWDICAR